MRRGFAVVLVAAMCLVTYPALRAGGKSTLHQAVLALDRERVHTLLDSGADVNAEDEDGFTALALAARHGDEEIVKLLLANGALPEHGDDPHKYPRVQAEIGGHEAIFHRLLFHEAISGPEPVRTRRYGPPENNDTYVQRALTALGYAKAGSDGGASKLEAVRAFRDSVKAFETGRVTGETLLYLWIMDPITRRESKVPYAAGECYVCLSRYWHRTMGRGLILSAGGCMGRDPPEISLEHVILSRKSRSELPKNDFVEVVTRQGDGCRASE